MVDDFATDLERLPGGPWVHRRGVGQDLMNWDEVYVRDVYRFRSMPLFRHQEVIVDIGANVGAFSALAHERNPNARIIAVEACAENIPVLRANVGEFATVIHAACCYYAGPIALANTCFEGGVNSGGSFVLTDPEAQRPGLADYYRFDDRALPKITLEQIMEQHNLDRIDVLKLDCEGSEFSILEGTTSLDRIEQMVGEWHGVDRFDAMCTRIMRGAGFHLTVLSGGELGTFWLSRWKNLERLGVYL